AFLAIVSVEALPGHTIGLRGSGRCGLLGIEAEATALIVPPPGKGPDSLELARRQADRLPALEDRLNDVRGEEGQRQSATDLARIPVVSPRQVPDRGRSPLREIIDPAKSVGAEG